VVSGLNRLAWYHFTAAVSLLVELSEHFFDLDLNVPVH
jgi:hypothetical protein